MKTHELGPCTRNKGFVFNVFPLVFFIDPVLLKLKP